MALCRSCNLWLTKLWNRKCMYNYLPCRNTNESTLNVWFWASQCIECEEIILNWEQNLAVNYEEKCFSYTFRNSTKLKQLVARRKPNGNLCYHGVLDSYPIDKCYNLWDCFRTIHMPKKKSLKISNHFRSYMKFSF